MKIPPNSIGNVPYNPGISEKFWCGSTGSVLNHYLKNLCREHSFDYHSTVFLGVDSKRLEKNLRLVLELVGRGRCNQSDWEALKSFIPNDTKEARNIKGEKNITRVIKEIDDAFQIRNKPLQPPPIVKKPTDISTRIEDIELDIPIELSTPIDKKVERAFFENTKFLDAQGKKTESNTLSLNPPKKRRPDFSFKEAIQKSKKASQNINNAPLNEDPGFGISEGSKISFNGTNYNVGKRIGRGGFSAIYEVSKDGDNKRYALKCQKITNTEITNTEITNTEITNNRTNTVARVRAEVAMQKCLRLAPIAYKETKDNTFTLMPMGSPLPAQLTVQHLREVLEDLNQLHKNGFSHNDIKLQNLIMYDGKLSLLDVGVGGPKGELPDTGTSSTKFSATQEIKDLECLYDAMLNRSRKDDELYSLCNKLYEATTDSKLTVEQVIKSLSVKD